ncbi:hypothetical protein M9194_20025 [Vibrio sp. S4M6]|uniref:hypothetical protein n=1 Tax=Vibrio sinus TaxID=2946865 RepID=UPI00202A8CFA|nr:hypothetical protein [Vibrio sinus]MCL9783716.1 hypothetical protein [Vibrio sinus]
MNLENKDEYEKVYLLLDYAKEVAVFNQLKECERVFKKSQKMRELIISTPNGQNIYHSEIQSLDKIIKDLRVNMEKMLKVSKSVENASNEFYEKYREKMNSLED